MLILESLVDNFEDWSKISSQNYIPENALVSNPGAIRTGRVWSIARAVQWQAEAQCGAQWPPSPAFS